VLAMVGSRDYFDAEEGQVNACISPRQPGSSIKPFLYALAIQSGMRLSDILPDTLVEFRLRDGTLFAPRNYGQQYHGPTRMREALASSFNVPAVCLIEQLGVSRFYDLLHRLGFRFLNKDAHHYGLSLSLGAAEVSLLELVNAYRVFAMQGIFDEIQCVRAMYDKQGDLITLPEQIAQRVFSLEVAHLITDMLSDNAARFKAFNIDNPLHLPFVCTAKTGTSKDYRDNWCVGYTTEYAVGVWVGNFNGASMQGVSGISGAAPLFRSVMLELHRDSHPGIFRCPETLIRRKICARSGKIAGSGCENFIEETYIAGNEPVDICDQHNPAMKDREYLTDSEQNLVPLGQKITIISPQNGDIYKVDPQVSEKSQRIAFKVVVAEDIRTVLMEIDGRPLVTQGCPFEYLWAPSRGEHVLEVLDDSDHSCNSRVKFTVN